MTFYQSSKTNLWYTPSYIFDALNSEFNFTLDVCANADNTKCEEYFDENIDGLKQEWLGTIWMNPPYGRDIGKWMSKALNAAENGATVVCLVPSNTDTIWWHDHIPHCSEVRFYKGRIKFGGASNSPPFASAIVIFKPNTLGQCKVLHVAQPNKDNKK